MDKIISDFGVQPIYLAAQAFNFLILLLILKKFLYRPILKVIENRRQTVSESLLKVKQIDQQFQATEQESAKQLAKVATRAQNIIDNANKTADQIIADAHNKAQLDIEKMIKKSKQEIEFERETVRKELLEELESLVVLGMKKVSGKVIDQTDHSKIVNKTIETLKDET